MAQSARTRSRIREGDALRYVNSRVLSMCVPLFFRLKVFILYVVVHVLPAFPQTYEGPFSCHLFILFPVFHDKHIILLE